MATADYEDSLLKRLQDPEYASEYLNEALKEESQELFMPLFHFIWVTLLICMSGIA